MYKFIPLDPADFKDRAADPDPVEEIFQIQ